VIAELCIADVKYYSFDKKLHKGQLVVHKELKADIEKIFNLILEKKFPVKMCKPIVGYGWDDNKSMQANNSSAFCYRFIAGTKRLSNHSFGRAVDINPFTNPVVHKDGSTSPRGAKYDLDAPGTFSESHFIVKAFKKLGWRWGGKFSKYKDNHHFDKK
jgi:hypothetical protein